MGTAGRARRMDASGKALEEEGLNGEGRANEEGRQDGELLFINAHGQ